MNEYWEIRKALLALLCAGDTICCVIPKAVIKRVDNPFYEVECTISEQLVVGFPDKENIQLLTSGGFHYEQPIEYIYAYNGRLFVYNENRALEYSHDERLKMVIYLAEAKSTIWVNGKKE
jgi:hypothetical protein